MDFPVRSTIAVSEIGYFARRWLTQVKEATVLGNVTGGVYLLLSSQKVIFLSKGKFRGPLTLNLARHNGNLDELQIGTHAFVYPGKLYFPDLALGIRWEEALIWRVSPPVKEPLPASDLFSNLKNLTQLVLDRRPSHQLAQFIPHLLGLQQGCSTPNGEFFYLLENIKLALQAQKSSLIAKALSEVLGKGSGLTPSGDDLCTGLILTFCRWGKIVMPSFRLEVLRHTVGKLDFGMTTTLGANFIQLALKGQADERLILALDGILCGDPDLSACADYLLSWGHSSGLDALTGIALALSFDNSFPQQSQIEKDRHQP